MKTLPEHYVVPGSGLHAGEYPGHRDRAAARVKLRGLLELGVATFIDLTEPGELEPYDALLAELSGAARHRRFAVADMGVPRGIAEVTAILDAIDEEIGAGRAPYLHCWGGVGRTGTIVACHLVRREGLDGETALARVAELFLRMPKSATRSSPETASQHAFVRGFPARDRFAGALLGLAAGDALGTTLEFTPPERVRPLDDMVGGGPFGLRAGEWTDDTSMALCLADSLVSCRGFDARDQMERYVRWYRDGLWSSTGRCFDIGNATRAALERFLATGDPRAGSADERTAGNGSLMRLAPVALAFAHDWPAAHDAAAASSLTTHAAPQAVDACRWFAGLLVGALRGTPKESLLAPGYAPEPSWWTARPLHAEIAEVASGSFLRREPPEIRGTGYVVRSLEAALWAFANAASFRDAALRAVNLGDDADTTGAVCGQLAGALHGASAIPASWRARLARADDLGALADALFVLAGSPRDPRAVSPPSS